MSSTNARALARQSIVNVHTATHDHENVVARYDTLHQLPTATETVESQRDGVTASSESEQHEFLAPINRLPDEILCVIFHLAHHLAHVDGWVTRTALEVGYVCRRWWNIVTGTGSFWTDVRTSQVDLARLSVERSQQALLEFTLGEFLAPRRTKYPLHAHASGIFPETAVKFLIANIGRIRKLVMKLNLETYSALFLRFASFIAPSLTTLRLEISEEGSIEYHISRAAFHDAESLASCRLLDAPSLTELSVQTLRLRGELTIYPNINSLSLRLLAGDLHVHDSSFIFGTLRAHERLTELCLALCAPLHVREHDTNAQLLHLNSLTLRVGELEDAGYLLSRMEIPNIMHVVLDLGTRLQAAPSTTMGSRLNKILSFLPLTFRQLPTNIFFNQANFAIDMSMKEKSKSPPTLTILLHWYGIIDAMLLRGIAKSLARKFPCLDTASYDQAPWKLREPNVGE